MNDFIYCAVSNLYHYSDVSTNCMAALLKAQDIVS